MLNFKQFCNEDKNIHAFKKNKITKNNLIKLIEKFKQNKTNLSIVRTKNKTNEIEVKLSNDVFVKKSFQGELRLYIVPDSMATHNYLSYVVDDDLKIDLSNSFTAYKSNGFQRDYIACVINKRSDVGVRISSLFDKLEYDGYEYADGKLVNGTTDDIKLI